MCLAIPAEVISIKDDKAILDIGGAQREASLVLLDEVKVGDYVIVHAGFAIQRMDREAALETLKLLREMVAQVP
jgi:hydrogenase expression/formation protein HypC